MNEDSYKSLKDIFVLMAEKIHLESGKQYPLFRADQSILKAEYPYIQWKIINENQDLAHQRNITYSDDPSNSKKVIESEKKASYVGVSFQFIDHETHGIAVAWSMAGKAFDWLSSEEGIEASRSKGFTPNILSRQITDRTTNLNPGFEYKVGFDVRFDNYEIKTTKRDRVNAVSLEVNTSV